MKFFSFAIFIYCLGFCQFIFSQNVAINDNGAVGNTYAILDVDITTNDKGVLIPRISTAERTAIAGLAATEEGLMVYDTSTKSFWYWDGSTWVQMQASGWLITGNTGTAAGTNFIGTTDNVSLSLRVNNQRSGLIDHVNGVALFGYQAGLNNIGVNNSFFGQSAGITNTTATRNTAVGSSSLQFNTVGSSNTSVGFSSMNNNTTATGNVAVGESALFTQSYNFGGSPYASCNVAVGYQSLYFNQPTSAANGTSNTAVGYESMRFNTTGSYNAAFGRHSLNANTTGDHNVGVGYSTLGLNTTGSRNTSVGYTALMNNTSGVQNIAVGTKALRDNQGGNHNVGVGYESMLLNQSGEFNTGVGTGSLYNNTTASWNVAMGAGSLFANSIGQYNTGIGSQALGQNTTANQNTAVGFQALYVQSFNNGGGAWNSNNVAVGYQALWSNLSTTTANGIGNSAIGTLALFNNIDGFNNTAVGVNADVNAASYNNSSCFGANTLITASDQVRIGNAAVTSIGGQVGWTTLSDSRVKINVQENVLGLAFIKKLKPVTYQYDPTAMQKIISPNGNAEQNIPAPNNIRYSGFFAQEVEQAAKDLDFIFSGVDTPKNENDLYGLRYGDFTVPLVKAVQEQQLMIEELQQEILLLKEELKNISVKN